MTSVSEPLTAPPRSVLDQDWRKILNYGLVLALALVFVALSNMPVGMDRRVVIEPYLSMGYLSLLWLPLVLGAKSVAKSSSRGWLPRQRGSAMSWPARSSV